MWQKSLAFVTALFLALSIGQSVFAAIDTSAMEKALDEELKSSHYDYKKGSVEIEDPKTFTGEKGEEIIGGIAVIETVRDGIFITIKREIHFYNTESKEMLTNADAAKVDGVKEYIDKNSNNLQQKVVYWLPMLLMILLIAVPAIVLYVVVPRLYSTSEYMNPIYERNDNPR
ncbi:MULTISPECIES: hypothetical protein [Exiguobacterium]|uniref:Uncharacterized protein n=1 Tax=Exiguobacterium oxidotolerans TaxID=223958 RepID=A0A653I757_9BACL|nr:MULTISPECIES: hypothetical protein [Exiguobacterium]ASI36102.1 hypothetical protein A0126_11115 [Exiguobacterium sp. N4-1P]VWX34888.1 conserved exported hypothetical protein [Exiguobacterium oxidotolerans]